MLTMTVRPLVYTILSLLELSFVAAPRAVAGFTGCKTPFLKDIMLEEGGRWWYKGRTMAVATGRNRGDCDIQIEIVVGADVPDLGSWRGQVM